jgi:hypothetical protein
VPPATAKSGCPSIGGQLTGQLLQSAPRLRLVGHPSFGGRRQVLCRGKPPHRQPRSRLRRHLLAFGTVSATVDVTFFSVQQKSSRQLSEYPAQFPAWHLGLFWRSTRPLPNRLFKGTPTALASLRICQARRPLTPALGLF